DDGTLVAVLAVPSHLTPADFLAFLGAAVEDLTHVRLLRDVSPHRYIALLKFANASYAEQFVSEFNGKPFSLLEPEVCSAVRVRSVQLVAGAEVEDQERSDAVLSLDAIVSHQESAVLDSLGEELPTCPVCLERMDARVTGLVTVVCQHTFHCRCLGKWGGGRCPVCRYSLTDAPTVGGEQTGHLPGNQCAVCSATENLWICLICGHIGCGRYVEAHAWQHYEQTGHLYSLELETQRVWDYAGDGYVHRLIQNKADGKLVELPDDTLSENAVFQQSVPPAKLDAIATEYTNLLTTQLDSQRYHYEQELALAHQKLTDAQRDLDMTRPQLTVAQQMRDRLREAEDEVVHIRKEKAAVEKRASKLEKRVSTLEEALKEEHALGTMIRSNYEKLRESEKERKQELLELREQVRDLMFFVESRDKIDNGELSEEVREGTIQPVPENTNRGQRSRQ
ncbi:hypothetical protein THASP1DRAFT_9531, partial [Thamnocephalis sphaerospora]